MALDTTHDGGAERRRTAPVKRSDVADKWHMWCADCGAKNHKNATECKRCGYGDEDTLFGVGRKQSIGKPEYTSDGKAGVYDRSREAETDRNE